MIAFLLMLVAIVAGVEYLSLRLGLKGVEYDVHPSKAAAEPDEPLQLITVIVNRRRRFLPFIRLNEDVPEALDIVGGRRPATLLSSRGALVSTAYMMPRQKLTRRTDFSVHSSRFEPMPMTSPVAFIWVPRVFGASANLSNGNRGNFATM